MSTIAQLLEQAKASPVFRRAKFLAARDREFLRNLVSWREARGLNQAEVAKRMGITQQSVSKFERYDGDPKMSTVRRYANAVGVVVTYIVADDANEQISAPADQWASGSAEALFRDLHPAGRNAIAHARTVTGYAASAKRTDFALSA